MYTTGTRCALAIVTMSSTPTPPSSSELIQISCTLRRPAMKIGNYQSMEKDHHLFDCFECGCCTFVCPSHISLVQQFRIAKAAIRKGRRAAG